MLASLEAGCVLGRPIRGVGQLRIRLSWAGHQRGPRAVAPVSSRRRGTWMLRSERLLEPARLEPACAAHTPVEGRLVPTLATELAELAGSAERSAAPCAQRCRQIHAILHPRTAAGPCGRLPKRTGRLRGARKRQGGSPGPGQRAVRRGRRGHPCRQRSCRDRQGCVRRRRHGSLRDAARRC